MRKYQKQPRAKCSTGGMGFAKSVAAVGIWMTRSARGSEGVESGYRDHSGPLRNGATVSDKSPRQGMAKKSGKSLKEKRADKRAKADQQSSTEASLHFKKH
jgi:hypothetical protein